MSRPAKQRRERLWTVIVWATIVIWSVVFVGMWFVIPDWLVSWWAFLYIPWLILVAVGLRFFERWWWSHSPWAWREVMPH